MYTDDESQGHGEPRMNAEQADGSRATPPAGTFVRLLGRLLGRAGYEIVSIASLIERYISDHRIARGSYLPAERELAEHLGCGEKALARALQIAEKKGWVTYDRKGWIVAHSAARDDRAFSFTQSAETHDRKLTTDVLEKLVRQPKSESDPFGPAEQAAHKALGLAEGSPFLVIVRFRLLEGRPRTLHR